MIYLIDTNTVRYIVRGKSTAARNSSMGLRGQDVGCISAITEGEMRYGLTKRPDAHSLRSAVDSFLLRIRVLPWDREEARAYGALRARLESKGKALENRDMLIAAHAIAAGATLVTKDKAFRHAAAELVGIVNWAVDL